MLLDLLGGGEREAHEAPVDPSHLRVTVGEGAVGAALVGGAEARLYLGGRRRPQAELVEGCPRHVMAADLGHRALVAPGDGEDGEEGEGRPGSSGVLPPGTASRAQRSPAGSAVRKAPLGEAAQPLVVHASQQLEKIPTHALPPAGGVHLAAPGLVLHLVTPLALVRQQVTKPAFPHVDLAAHFFTAPLQLFGSDPASARAFATWPTHFTYWP